MTKATGVGRGNNAASHRNRASAGRHPAWRPGSHVASNGYVKVRVGKEHPLADPNGYAYEHLVVWCSAGKPRPPKGFLLHHSNEDKTDNRIGNLTLMKRTDHSQQHAGGIPDAWVFAIRETYADKVMNMRALAAHYEIPIQRVSKIIRGEIRKQAGGRATIGSRRHD